MMNIFSTRLPYIIVLGMFSYLFYMNGWVSEDAYISFRSLEQFFAGNGLVWNAHERVQAYTHPLWFGLLLVMKAFSPDVFLNAIILSFVCCLGAATMTSCLFRDREKWMAVAIFLISSIAFIDYASSGLENALSYLLMAYFLYYFFRALEPGLYLMYFRRALFVFGLLLLVRHDHLLITLPAVLYLMLDNRHLGFKRLVGEVLMGVSPFIIWTGFSVIYYGFPFPNTAYAKLFTGMARNDLVLQGAYYTATSFLYDLTTLIGFAAGLWALMTHENNKYHALAAGVVLNLIYIIWIGGDFMRGRFFAVPFFFCVVAMAKSTKSRKMLWVLAMCGVALTFANQNSTFHMTKDYFVPKFTQNGIADEKGFFYPGNSLTAYIDRDKSDYFPRHQLAAFGVVHARSPEKVIHHINMGMLGYFIGLDKIVIDRLGLTDPLLARLPAKPGSRVGHFERKLPEGYLETLKTGANQIKDPKISALYEDLKMITQAPIWDAKRWKVIVKMNLGL